MAIKKTDSNGREYVIVERNDTLWDIADTYLGAGNRYTQLAAINKMNNPNLIHPGQTIYLEKTSSSSGSSSKSSSAKTVTITTLELQADVEDTLYVMWTWDKHGNTEEYEVKWEYYTKNLKWFGGVSTTTTTKDLFATYSIPSNATLVRVSIKPVSKTYKSGDKDVAYFTANFCKAKEYQVIDKPATPSSLSVELNGLELKAEVSNLKDEPQLVQFEVVKDNTTTVKKEKVKVETGNASYSCTVAAGSFYKVRCRAIKNDIYSEWTDYSNNFESSPAVPAGFTKCEPGEPSVDGPTIALEWASITTAVSYDIQYTNVKSYFDTTDKPTTKTGITTTSYLLVDGLENGKEYFFRIRSVNSKGAQSEWSEISNVVLGKEPAPPTTWSSTTTVIVGEPLYFYWTHNSEDGSSLTYSHIRVLADGVEVLAWDIDHTQDDEETSTGSYTFDTSAYAEGTRLQWAVRTAGISKTYSDYSVERIVDIYKQPTLRLTLTDVDGNVFDELSSFPINVSAIPEPATQSPIWYHLEITSNEIYETIDNVGNVKMVSAGEQLYSEHFDISTALETVISAGDVNLENNKSYTITCTVTMDSGLTAVASSEFTVSWVDTVYTPNMQIAIDQDKLSAMISPYCESTSLTYCKVNLVNGEYQVDSETTYDFVCRAYTRDDDDTIAVIVPPVGTLSTGEKVYQGVTADGDEILYSEIITTTPVEDVILSVYRREFDGGFTLLPSAELTGDKNTYIVDPHPALDYARYRIVAKSTKTGAVSYYDPPGQPVGCKSVVIQWDEAWSQFDTFGVEDPLAEPPWSGSMLKLPYNIDVSNKNAPDTSLVEYAGRKHPVSYYGTQLGETATWNVVIEKSDIETLYALRRLSIWMGDVYVREPSGSGYWANIKVTFSQKHRELTIPVTIDVTRVEGGA